MLLEIRVKNMKKIFMIFCGVIIGIFVIQYESYAVNVAFTETEAKRQNKPDDYITKEMYVNWYKDGNTNIVITNEDLRNGLLVGDVGQTLSGVGESQYGIVMFIARDIVEHGGYFCPYQIQCQNMPRVKQTWTDYFLPDGYDNSKCAWLCEKGYSGEKCKDNSNIVSLCDNSSYEKDGENFENIKMNTETTSSSQENTITAFHSQFNVNYYKENYEFYYKEYDVILGAIKFLEHGIIAVPTRIDCGILNWPDMDSFVEKLSLPTAATYKEFNEGVAPKGTILCAQGYTANVDNNECIPIDANICNISDSNFCDNFDIENFDADIHYMAESTNCVKYFCKEPGTAFKSTTDTTCVECSNGGPDPNNGTCISCDTGQYFDEDNGTCETAVAYSKSDMQYGKGETKNTVPLAQQCWLIATPEEYAECVKNDGKRPYLTVK